MVAIVPAKKVPEAMTDHAATLGQAKCQTIINKDAATVICETGSYGEGGRGGKKKKKEERGLAHNGWETGRCRDAVRTVAQKKTSERRIEVRETLNLKAQKGRKLNELRRILLGSLAAGVMPLRLGKGV